MNSQHAPSPRKNSGVKTVLIVLSIVGVIGFLGIALLVGGVVYFVSKARTDSDQLVVVNSSDGISSISLPSNWTQFPPSDRNADACIQRANMFSERYVMVISESKSELAAIFDPNSGEAIATYKDLVLDGLGEALSLNRNSVSDVNLNGMQGFRGKLNGMVDGVDIVYWVSVVEGKNDFHQVHVWTTAAMATKNKPILFEVADSFQERF